MLRVRRWKFLLGGALSLLISFAGQGVRAEPDASGGGAPGEASAQARASEAAGHYETGVALAENNAPVLSVGLGTLTLTGTF